VSIKIKVKTSGSFPKVDSMKVSIECPNCKTQNIVTLKQIEREESIKCVKCKTRIHLSDTNKSIKKATDKIQESFDELERNLKSLGS
jgi:predicted Zn finger-like uncharacterized protein